MNISRRSGFTLIELLVVISIISLLISILLPALSAARQQGWVAQNLSNLRQLTLMSHAYGADNKQWLPQASRQGGPSPWTATLYHLGYNNHIFIYWSPGRDRAFMESTVDHMKQYVWSTNWQYPGYGVSHKGMMPRWNEDTNLSPRRLDGYALRNASATVSPLIADPSRAMLYMENASASFTGFANRGYFFVDPQLAIVTNPTFKVFTYNGSAARSYLDGHAQFGPATEIRWNATSQLTGTWTFTSAAQLGLYPWVDRRF